MARGLVRGLAVLALTACAGCGSARAFVANPGPYDRVPEDWRPALARARIAFERGELAEAQELVDPLARAQPKLLAVRLFQQEIELARLAREGQLGELSASGPEEARAALAARAERQAGLAPSAEAYLLAARLAPDPAAGLALLAVADTIDPACVWVAYARAWWHYRARDFKLAREELAKALRIDGGHPWSMRLSATLEAGAGDYAEAATALELWLERTADDPLHSSRERADALLDLAAVRVLLDESDEALELLEALDPRALRDPQRAEAVRAAALAASDDSEAALEAAQRAAALNPRGLLPVVQEALLHQREGRAEDERQAWQRLLELTATPAEASDPAAIDFEAALFRLQAQARLQRLALTRP